jgi:hypothetical protein
VFGIAPPSLEQIAARVPGAPRAIAVFASEYRPGDETVHRRHADRCLARTGVARVGTTEPFYDARRRGFLPFVEDDPHAFRVRPARYAAYIAVRLPGQEERFGPLNFSLPQRFLGAAAAGDAGRRFWVPLHKLFPAASAARPRPLVRAGGQSSEREVAPRPSRAAPEGARYGNRGCGTRPPQCGDRRSQGGGGPIARLARHRADPIPLRRAVRWVGELADSMTPSRRPGRPCSADDGALPQRRALAPRHSACAKPRTPTPPRQNVAGGRER